eukprot:Ihof_evm12s57 gene=Ihof_evmTU12s57
MDIGSTLYDDVVDVAMPKPQSPNQSQIPEEQSIGYDLYTDLDIDTTDQPDVMELRKNYNNTTNELERIKKELKKIQRENEGLEKMNIALKKNISCLYKTAKLEIDRKNEEIKILRE